MDVMPFGKYRGTPLAEVPKPYLRWMLTNATDLRPETREAFEAAVNGKIPREPGDDSELEPKPRRAPDRARTAAPPKAEHVACHRCGGGPNGRKMIHVECMDQDDVPF